MGLHKVCIVLSDTDLPNHTDGWSLSMPLNQTFMSIMSIVTAADAGLILYKGILRRLHNLRQDDLFIHVQDKRPVSVCSFSLPIFCPLERWTC